MVARIDGLKKSPVIKELKDLYSRGIKVITPEEITGALKGKPALLQQLNSMFKVAKNEISILTTSEGLNELYLHSLDELRKAKDRGVGIKIAATIDTKCADAIKALSGIAEIRELNKKEIPVKGRFFIVDGKELVFSLTDSKVHATQEVAVWSKSEFAATNVLAPLFKLVWEHSKPVK